MSAISLAIIFSLCINGFEQSILKHGYHHRNRYHDGILHSTGHGHFDYVHSPGHGHFDYDDFLHFPGHGHFENDGFDYKPMLHEHKFHENTPDKPNHHGSSDHPNHHDSFNPLNLVDSNPTFQNPGLDNIGMPKDGKNHPCYRVCKAGEKMTCYYKFHVEWYFSMSKACMNCPWNTTDCDNPDCVPANGMARAITVVNRKMPGPSIEVCKEDTLVVDVENSLMAAGTTIHWHGLHQKETPYMDGTPFVTQCPIQPESTFRYTFNTPNAGTYFWHSHIGMERGDGTTGALIIREPAKCNPHRRLYDVDNSEHVLLISDWINNVSISLFTDHHHSSGDNRPQYLLVNGRGRFRFTDGKETGLMKAPVFTVEKGKRYRFRMINAEFLNCPVELSVDGHNISVIAADGFDLAPFTVSKLVSYAGERFDFVINADKPVDSYWIRIRGLMECANPNNTVLVRQVAALLYKGAADEPSTLTWNNRTGLTLNEVQQGEEQNVTVPISTMRSILPDDATSKPVADHKFYISFDMHLKNNIHYHRVPYYAINKLPNTTWLYTPQLNHISMKMPKSPLLVTRPTTGFCNESTISPSCKTEYCQCPHVLNVKRNSVVEMILIDEGTQDTNHPLHLHGHSFRVVAMRKVGDTTTVDEVKKLDNAGNIERNLKRAPVKDTVTIPEGGYTVIRFIANNPGYWLFHCHIEFHAEIGMALVFKVGEHEDMKPVPKGFPQCGDYMPKK